MVGSTQRVLVDAPVEEGRRASSPARTENDRWVNFAGPASLIGHFVDVVIVEGAAAIAAWPAWRASLPAGTAAPRRNS